MFFIYSLSSKNLHEGNDFCVFYLLLYPTVTRVVLATFMFSKLPVELNQTTSIGESNQIILRIKHWLNKATYRYVRERNISLLKSEIIVNQELQVTCDLSL